MPLARADENAGVFQSTGVQHFSGGWGWRHVVILLVFMVVFICYADRTNIGIVLAQHDFPGIPHRSKGSILSAFFVGYLSTQILGGVLAQKWGGKATLLLAATTWTFFDVLTPMFAFAGFTPLYLCRVGVGLGEGLLMPTQHALVNFWVPAHERAFLIAVVTCGQEFGSVLANLLSPQLLKGGVTCVFSAWGLTAMLAALLFLWLAASAPELHTSCVRTGEALWIQQRREAPHFAEVRRAHAAEPVMAQSLLGKPCVLAIIAAHAGVNYAWYVVLSWMPTFFAEAHGLDLAARPHLLAAPYAAGLVGVLLAGRASDALVARGLRVRHARKAAQLVGALGVLFFLQLAARAESAGWASTWMMAVLFFGRTQSLGFWVNMVDVCPQTAATLMGVSNTVGTIPGIVGQPITQSILSASGSWSAVFGIGGVVGVAAAVVFAAFGDDKPIDTRATRSDSVDAGRAQDTLDSAIGKPNDIE
uniref:Major facilitator superfamily (MFS) profile domain-containing protein n=1 Tax=Pyrodinium bahamense TaxID=73915 RepID=A0A7R9ZVN6_9DINO|mmetsp:Transcript_11789/g.32273  ORF Transcript_11789/g.32273 Transcript_11789/m.32273 type:complete len:475 (+) Transcript_11789:23-1447(+)